MSPNRSSLLALLLVGCLAGLTVAGPITPAAAAGGSDHASSTCGLGPAGTADAADRTALSIETDIAPGASYDRLTSPAALRAARANGTLVPASTGIDRTYEDEVVAYRDVVVHRVALNGSATALADRLAAANGSSPGDQLRALAANGTLDFEYWGPSACPPELALNASLDRGALRVLPDPANDTVSLVLDTDRLLFHPLDGGPPTTDTIVYGHHRIQLTLPGAGPLADETVIAENGYEVEPAHVALASRHDGLVRVEPEPGQVLRGRTTLAPGSEVTVVLIPAVGTDLLEVDTARVNRSRSFELGFDLSDAPDGAIYAVHVETVTDPPSVEAGATVVAVGHAAGALVDVRTQTSDGTILYGPTLTTTHGGFVAVRNAAGGLVGVSEYLPPGAAVAQIDLDPGLTRSQRVTVTVYRDVDGNRAFTDDDRPYRVDGEVVRDAAWVRVKRDDTPSTPVGPSPGTPRPPSPATTSSAPPSVDSSPPGSVTTSPGQPGFGLVLGLVGLLVAVWSAVRSRC